MDCPVLAHRDLNLLVALDVLLREQSVTRAASCMGLSQPAMSRTLGRLRDLFDDRLLVRTPQGMTPTPRAEALVEPLRATLEEIESLIRPPSFVPESASGILRIAADEQASRLILPPFIAALRVRAPELDLRVSPAQPDDAARLVADQLDLVVGSVVSPGSALYRRRLLSASLVCLLRRDHPVHELPWTPRTFASLAHAALGGSEGPVSAAVDIALAGQGLTRRVVATFPDAAMAAATAARSDLVLVLPRWIAQQHGDGTLCVREPPLELDPVVLYGYWHERRHADPAHVWVRHHLAAECAALDADAARGVGDARGGGEARPLRRPLGDLPPRPARIDCQGTRASVSLS